MYNSIGFAFFACLLCVHAQDGFDQPKNFTAVVNEYDCYESTSRNLDSYEMVMQTVGMQYKADIVVFPERALTPKTKDSVIVPDPKDNVIPYKNGTYGKKNAMFRISKAAAEFKIYVVINLFEKVECKNNTNCPDRGFFVYDTNVAFDRQGAVIARYRKLHVSGNEADKPDKAELSTFKTDFGVTFGLFTGLDILFKTPAVDLVREKNVKYIAFPNRWQGEFPFLTGIQVQDGWSYAMNVTFLASGVNDIQTGCSGTGIYVPRKHKIASMYDKSGSSFMYWGVPTKAAEKSFLPSESNERNLNLLQDPTIPESQGKDLNINKGKFKDRICHNGLCCNFDLKYNKLSDSSNHTYRAVAYQGLRPFGSNLNQSVAYCAVVLCTDGNCAKKPEDGNYPLEFDEANISGDFKKENSLQFPSTLTWTYDPNGVTVMSTMPYSGFTFEKRDAAGKSNVAINLKSKALKGLVTFGIFGRNFE